MRYPLGCRLALAVHLHPTFEKAVDEFEHIGRVHMLAHANHETVVVDAVEERLQINVHYPAVSLSDSGLCVAHRLVCVAPRPKAVAVCVEVSFPVALDDLGQRLLDESVRYRGNTKESFPTVWLGNFHALDWLGAVGACSQLRAYAGPVRFKVGTNSK